MKPSFKRKQAAAGVVPACRSVDCVSIFFLSLKLRRRCSALVGVDEADPYSRSGQQQCDSFARPKIGIPSEHQMQFFESQAAARDSRRYADCKSERRTGLTETI